MGPAPSTAAIARSCRGKPVATRMPFILLTFILLAGVAHGSQQKINALLVGKVMPEHPPARWFSSEPLMEYTLVPTGSFRAYSYTIDEARRLVRIYFPRNRERLAEYDFLAFRGVFTEALVPVQIENLRSTIVEDGSVGFLELGGITKNWAEGVNRPWVESTLAEVFPNDPGSGEVWEQNKLGSLPYKVIVNEDPSLPPVLSMFLPLGIEEVRGYWYICLLVPQQGTTTWGWARGAYPGVLGGDPPWLLSWRYGKGMTWSVADSLDTPWWDDAFNVVTPDGSSSDQRYGLDILMNMVLHSLDRPLPEDILLMNQIRLRFRLTAEKISSMYSFMDFVERFGVSSSRLMGEQGIVEEIVENAENLYLDGLYQDSLDELDVAGEALHALKERALRWKDQALLWIYLIEWAAVTGTLALAGYFTYTVMLKRRLYRRVALTRFGQT